MTDNRYISFTDVVKWLDKLIHEEKVKFFNSHEKFQEADGFEEKICHYTDMVQQNARIIAYENIDNMINPASIVYDVDNNNSKAVNVISFYDLFSKHIKVCG